MNKNISRKKKGFTLAELMLVIAITGILAAISFIFVARYLRVLEHMKYDSIAKEMFITAQNHLSMANNEGYLNANEFGTKEGKKDGFDFTSDDSGVYYYVVDDTNDTDINNTMLNIMLPFGSIEETARKNGSYIIRYNKETAQVLDVFYSEKSNSRFGHTFTDLYTDSNDNGVLLMNLREEENKQDRRFYKEEANGRTSIIGYYGGTIANPEFGDEIPLPFIRVNNAEELKVNVKTTELPTSSQLKLYIEGQISGTKKVIILKDKDEIYEPEYEVILDSITENADDRKHFINMYSDFTPGENLIVYAEASDNTVLTNIAKTVEVTTNSLFGDNSTVANGVSERVAAITNIRHLENLQATISGVDTNTIVLHHALQENDLDWSDFANKTKSAGYTYIYNSANSATPLATDYYYPVDLTTDYDGGRYKISNVAVNHSGPSGLFGTVSGKQISNLQLVDFNITGSTYAGTLAGVVSNNSVITNVVAYDDNIKSSVSGTNATGGLIGHSTGSRIERSAAAVYVSGGNAGGLIGLSENSTISQSYSGAHTNNGAHLSSIDVVGTSAGGLIGRSTGSTLSNVYSTASVNGGNAGGLIGYYDGPAINNAYAVGYVVADKNNTANKGGFIGYDASSSAHVNCGYMLAANDGLLSGLGNLPNNTEINKLDLNKDTYGAFIISKTDGKASDAHPHDQYLINVYTHNGNVKYQYQSIEDLTGSALTGEYFVNDHYGDWPDYETQVINE